MRPNTTRESLLSGHVGLWTTAAKVGGGSAPNWSDLSRVDLTFWVPGPALYPNPFAGSGFQELR